MRYFEFSENIQRARRTVEICRQLFALTALADAKLDYGERQRSIAMIGRSRQRVELRPSFRDESHE